MKTNQSFDMTQLKILAVIFMIVDHIGAIILDAYFLNHNISIMDGLIYDDFSNIVIVIYWICRLIGRLAFPLFAFGIAQSLIHTKSPLKYLSRLFLFSIVSEPFFDKAASGLWIDWSYQNVMIPFTIAVFTIIIFNELEFTKILNWIVLALGMLLSYFFESDYSWMGVLMVFSFYYFRDNKPLRDFSTLAIMALQFTAVFAHIFISQYNQKKGTGHKYFFYVFYPLHLYIFYLIQKLIIT